MFEDLRRALSRTHKEREKKELLSIEKERRLAFIKARKAEAMSAERERSADVRRKALESLQAQQLREKETKLELSALQKKERQRKLRPYVAVSRAILAPVTLPLKFVAKHVAKGAKPTFKSVVIGDIDVLTGKPPGKVTPKAPPEDIGEAIFGKRKQGKEEDITKDILGGGGIL